MRWNSLVPTPARERVLAHMRAVADPHGIVRGGARTMQVALGMPQSSARDAIEYLIEAGKIEAVKRSNHCQNIYRLVDPVAPKSAIEARTWLVPSRFYLGSDTAPRIAVSLPRVRFLEDHA